MYVIDNQSRQAVYEQIVAQTERFVMTGLMTADQPMPSVRSLSMELSVNPNTIQKAYAELERQNVIYALPGRGNFISPDIGAVAKQEKERQLAALRTQLQQARNAGVEKTEILSLLDAVYEGTTVKTDGKDGTHHA